MIAGLDQRSARVSTQHTPADRPAIGGPRHREMQRYFGPVPTTHASARELRHDGLRLIARCRPVRGDAS
jgi:hypothetical protein